MGQRKDKLIKLWKKWQASVGIGLGISIILCLAWCFGYFNFHRTWQNQSWAIWLIGSIMLLAILFPLRTRATERKTKDSLLLFSGAAVIISVLIWVAYPSGKLVQSNKENAAKKSSAKKDSTATTTAEDKEAGPVVVITTDTATQRKAVEAAEECARNVVIADSFKRELKSKDNTIVQLRNQADFVSGTVASAPGDFSKKMDVFIAEMKRVNANLEKPDALTVAPANKGKKRGNSKRGGSSDQTEKEKLAAWLSASKK